jgi:hypothetical protein
MVHTEQKTNRNLIIKPKSGLIDINLKDLWEYRDLLFLLVSLGIVTVYKQTLLEFFWFIIPTVLNAGAYLVIFGLFTRFDTGVLREFMNKLVVLVYIRFEGSGVDEKSYVLSCSDPEFQLPEGKEVICIDPVYFRPTEVELLIGDATKAKEILNWKPKYSFDELVKDMMVSDIKLFRKQKQMNELGYGKVVR